MSQSYHLFSQSVVSTYTTALLLASFPLGLLRPTSSLLQDEELTEYPLHDNL